MNDDRQARIIWLERLAKRCKMHAYADKAQRLRAMSDALNRTIPEADRVGPWDDRCQEPVPTATIRQFVQLVDAELRPTLER